jgi:hypothetical protein
MILGISGTMYSGKSTAANLLEQRALEAGRPVVRLPFAKAVKELALSLGWDGHKDAKGRHVLQHLGTDVCRSIDNDYWIKKWLLQLPHDLTNTLVIADDVRFPNEVAAIHSLGGKVIEIRRFGWLKRWWIGRKHRSERGIKADIVIPNRGTMDAMAKLLFETLP